CQPTLHSKGASSRRFGEASTLHRLSSITRTRRHSWTKRRQARACSSCVPPHFKQTSSDKLQEGNHIMNNIKWLAVVASGTCMACAGSTQNSKTTLASTSSCQQLPDSDATVQQLYTPGNVYAAKPVTTKVFRARANQPTHIIGASLYTHAELG